MDIQYSENIQLNAYLKSTKSVCICTSVSIFLILVFIISPLKDLLMISRLGKITTLLLLGYALYINLVSTNLFSQTTTNLFDGNFDTVKTNIICSYIFSLFIFILIITVFRKLF